jgi:hypothetical protein
MIRFESDLLHSDGWGWESVCDLGKGVQTRLLKHSDGVCGKAAKFVGYVERKTKDQPSEYNHRFRVKITVKNVFAESLCSSIGILSFSILHCPIVLFPDRTISPLMSSLQKYRARNLPTHPIACNGCCRTVSQPYATTPNHLLPF